MQPITRSIQVQTPDCIKPIYDVLQKELDRILQDNAIRQNLEVVQFIEQRSIKYCRYKSWKQVRKSVKDNRIALSFLGKDVVHPVFSLKYVWNYGNICDRLLA